jgi:hypothetical protein
VVNILYVTPGDLVEAPKEYTASILTAKRGKRLKMQVAGISSFYFFI